jgi:predicted RNase H-like HicB family nuclease
MTQYAIVIERTKRNYGAYVPVSEVKENIREAIKIHLEGMAEDGEPVPQPSSTVDYIAA